MREMLRDGLAGFREVYQRVRWQRSDVLRRGPPVGAVEGSPQAEQSGAGAVFTSRTDPGALWWTSSVITVLPWAYPGLEASAQRTLRVYKALVSLRSSQTGAGGHIFPTICSWDPLALSHVLVVLWKTTLGSTGWKRQG